MTAYFFVCLAIGALGFSLVAVAALVFQDRFTWLFFGFFSSFSILMTASAFVIGIGPNGVAGMGTLMGNSGFLASLLVLAAANGWFLSALPALADYLRGSSGWSRTFIWTCASFVCVLLLAVTIEPHYETYEFNLPIPVVLIVQALFAAAIVYSLPGIIRRARSHDGSLESRFARRFNFLVLIFMPGMLADSALASILPVRFFPALYALTAIMFASTLIAFIRASFERAKADQTEPANTGPVIPVATLDRLGLTNRELEVATLLISGLGNRAIADRLFVSMPTVKTHAQNIYRKAGVRSRFELVRLAQVHHKMPAPHH